MGTREHETGKMGAYAILLPPHTMPQHNTRADKNGGREASSSSSSVRNIILSPGNNTRGYCRPPKTQVRYVAPTTPRIVEQKRWEAPQFTLFLIKVNIKL